MHSRVFFFLNIYFFHLCGQYTAWATLSYITAAALKQNFNKSFLVSYMDALHLNTCQRELWEGLGHSWNGKRIWGQSDWIQLALPDMRLGQASHGSHILFSEPGPNWCSNGRIDESGNNRRTNKSRLRQSSHQILIRGDILLPPSPVWMTEWLTLDKMRERYFFLCSWTLTAISSTLRNIQWTILTALLIAFN